MMNNCSEKKHPSDTKLSIFMIDDNENDVNIIKFMLRDFVESNSPNLAISINHRSRISSGITAIKENEVDLILLSLGATNDTGVKPIDEIRDHGLFQPIIVLSDKEDESIAIEAMRHGAQDYLVKGEISEKLLSRSIRYAIERHKLRVELRKAEEKIHKLHGLLPICARCKQVKDDHGYWQQIEKYISEYTDVQFTHGYCPKCFDECMEEIDRYVESNKSKPKQISNR